MIARSVLGWPWPSVHADSEALRLRIEWACKVDMQGRDPSAQARLRRYLRTGRVIEDLRTVAMSAGQADLLNELTERLIREGDSRAMRLGSLVIAYKFAEPPQPVLPSNVYPIVKHAGDNWSRKVGA